MSKIKWSDALAARADWAGVGNVKGIYRPIRELLSRWQKAYQAANNLRKRPNLTEAVTYALILAHDRLRKECVRLEEEVAQREATAAALEAAREQSSRTNCNLRNFCEAMDDDGCVCDQADNETTTTTPQNQEA